MVVLLLLLLPLLLPLLLLRFLKFERESVHWQGEEQRRRGREGGGGKNPKPSPFRMWSLEQLDPPTLRS